MLSDGMEISAIGLAKVIPIPVMAQMSVRARSDSIHLSYLDARPSIAAPHGVSLTSEVAELDPRKESDVVVADFTRADIMLPKSAVIEYAKWNCRAVTTASREISEQFARILYIQTSVAQDASPTVLSTLFRDKGASE